jgi:acetyl esterase/lipase
MEERGQPCPRGTPQTCAETRGQSCPRSVRKKMVNWRCHSTTRHEMAAMGRLANLERLRYTIRHTLMLKGQSMKFSQWLFASLLVPISICAADQPQVLPLWPNGAPGSEGKSAKEVVEDVGKGEHRVSGIHNPSLTVFLPAKDKASGAAVIVIPGGGHRFLSIDSEGYNVGRWLSERGIAGFVLKHRLARETNSTYQIQVHSLQDTQRAIRLVRSRALEWGVDSARVGMLGFSAGGELVALASMNYDNGIEGAADPVDRQNSKPAFQALLYPGSSRSITVNKDSPPAFLACAYNDRADISEGLANVYLSFKKAGVPAELHIYSSGGHGFGYRESNRLPIGSWPARFQEWLADRKFLAKP